MGDRFLFRGRSLEIFESRGHHWGVILSAGSNVLMLSRLYSRGLLCRPKQEIFFFFYLIKRENEKKQISRSKVKMISRNT